MRIFEIATDTNINIKYDRKTMPGTERLIIDNLVEMIQSLP